MSERLVFGYGTSGHTGEAPARGSLRSAPGRTPEGGAAVLKRPAVGTGQRADWAYIGLLAFTAVLFLRPQEQIRALAPLHLAEITAIFALLSLLFGRLGRGLTVSRYTPELGGVVALGAIILATAPFSIWPGGAIGTFTDVYVKVILIFLLMVNTLTSPKRVEQFMWLMVVATGYLAFRAVFDYARGVNLSASGRVWGAVGGIFGNPNDLALNMVAVLPLAASLALRESAVVKKLAASVCAVFMIGAVVASGSRSGSVGLAAMTLFMGGYLLRRRPGVAMAAALALVLAMPFLPASYWYRMSSITDESRDETGSREARQILFRESYAAFLEHPLTGVGAGQFKNYNPEGRQEAWQETHNVILQVAAELGVVGVTIFMFLVARAALAGTQVRRLLRRAGHGGPRSTRANAPPADASLTPDEIAWMRAQTAALTAALVGWFVCAMFASVAYNWTFYYLLALAIAPREILIARVGAARKLRQAAPALRVQGARA
jgi:putative inorganic carbon (hco3(-)) transporter